MLFDNSVTLPNSKIFASAVSVLAAIVLVMYMKKSKLGELSELLPKMLEQQRY